MLIAVEIDLQRSCAVQLTLSRGISLVAHSNLRSAHKGYIYQDVATAFFMAKLLAHQSGSILIDKKLVPRDRFDDLTIYADGKIIRRQFKHGESHIVAEKGHFSSDKYDLRLDELLEAHLELKKAGSEADEYRICVTWHAPDSESDLGKLISESQRPKSFPLARIRIFQFQIEKLWPPGEEPKISSLKSCDRNELADFLGKLVVETGCPRYRTDDTEILSSELGNMIHTVLRDEVGVGAYPNKHISPATATPALVHLASLKRGETESEVRPEIIAAEVNVASLERELGLRRDYGRLEQEFPLQEDMCVDDAGQLNNIIETVLANRITVLQGSPGSGKSWLISQLIDLLESKGNLVAYHYCYLEPGDSLARDRIKTITMYSNLLAELIDQNESLRENTSNPYSAGPDELLSILQQITKANPEQNVFLVIDGLDHISRVAAGDGAISLGDVNIPESLSVLNLPKGVHLLVGSQPGEHLAPLLALAPAVVNTVPWGEEKLKALAEKLALISHVPLDNQDAGTLNALMACSDGNPLLFTYLYRETFGVDEDGVRSAEQAIERINAGQISDLRSYYQHLTLALDDITANLTRLLGLVEFSISRADLKELFDPMSSPGLPGAIKQLAPVLVERSEQSGIRIYHESFRRFIVEECFDSTEQRLAVIDHVCKWLESKGPIRDQRAFLFLLPMIKQTGDFDEVVKRVDFNYIAEAVGDGHSQGSIIANINVAVSAAAAAKNYTALAVLAHLRQAVDYCFQSNPHDEQWLIAFTRICGLAQMEDRMLIDGRPTFEHPTGIRLCKIIDDEGGVAPWSEYLAQAYTPERDDTQVQVARFQGHLCASGFEAVLDRLVQIHDRAGIEDQEFCKEVHNVLLIKVGIDSLLQLLKRVKRDCFGYELILLSCYSCTCTEGLSAYLKKLIYRYWSKTKSLDFCIRLREIGAPLLNSKLRCIALQGLEINIGSDQWGISNPSDVWRWLVIVSDRATIDLAELQLERRRVYAPTRYREWLAYCIDISLAEANADSEAAVNALIALNTNTGVLEGTPRACDLYSIHATYAKSIERGLTLASISSRFDEAIEAVYNLSKSTVSRLQNYRSGPLVADELATLLLKFVDGRSSRIILEVLERMLKDTENGEDFYSISADHEMLLARACHMCGQEEQSLDHIARGAKLLLGYGYRRDMALFEPLAAVSLFAESEGRYAKECLERLQPLATAVFNRTDGKETKHILNAWFEELVLVDSGAAGKLLMKAQLQPGNQHSWIFERAIWRFVRDIEGASLLHRLNLLHTISIDEDYLDKEVDIRLGIVEEFLLERNALGIKHFLLAAAEIEGGVPHFSIHNYEKVVHLGSQFGIQLPSIKSKDSVLGQTKKHQPEQVAESEERTVNGALDANASPAQVLAWIKLHRSMSLREDKVLDQVAAILFDPIINLTERLNTAAFSSFAKVLAEELWMFQAGEILSRLAAKLAGSSADLAATLFYTYAYTRSRGAGGWGSLGGQKYHEWLSMAMQIDPEVSSEILVAEIERILFSGQTHSLSLHIMEFQAEFVGIKEAMLTLNSVIDVIEERLPLDPDDSTALFERYEADNTSEISPDEAVSMALSGRIGDPILAAKIAAVSGVTELIRECPETLIAAYRLLLAEEAPSTTLHLSLLILWLYEDAAYPVSSELESELERLLTVQHCAIQWLAHEILAKRKAVNAPSSGSGPVLRVVDARRKAQILSLGQGDLIAGCRQVIPGFDDEIVSSFESEWERDVETSEALQQRRWRMSTGHNGRNYPATPILHWRQELFEQTFQKELCRIPAALLSSQNWDEEAKRGFLSQIQPELELSVRWFNCRSIRPEIPLPNDQTKGSDYSDVIDEQRFEDWKRIGYFEKQIVSEEYSPASMVSSVYAFLGMASSTEQIDFESTFPFGWSNSPYEFRDDEPRVKRANGPFVGQHIAEDWLFGESTLMPMSQVVVALGLELDPCDRLCWLDQAGNEAIIFRHWAVGPAGDLTYQMTPRISGYELIVRRDVFNYLDELFGGLKVIWGANRGDT